MVFGIKKRGTSSNPSTREISEKNEASNVFSRFRKLHNKRNVVIMGTTPSSETEEDDFFHDRAPEAFQRSKVTQEVSAATAMKPVAKDTVENSKIIDAFDIKNDEVRKELVTQQNISMKELDELMTANDAARFPPSVVDVINPTVDSSNTMDSETVTSPRSVMEMTNYKSLAERQFLQKSRSRQNTLVLKEAPSARESAFSGPPRYDWIDIETAAAVKVQSVFRRNQVIRLMEELDMLTKSMRNRQRRRRNKIHRNFVSKDVPAMFRCFDFGFLFGDASLEEEERLEAENKAKREEMFRQQTENETKARKFRMRKKASDYLLESVEIVEEVA